MVCRFCNAEIGDNHRFCPECGKRQDTLDEFLTDAQPQQEKKKKSDAWKVVLLIIGFVVAAGILALVLLNSFGIDLFSEQDILAKQTYVVPKEKVSSEADTVVAKLAGKELDNALLQVFVTEEFDTFFAEYYDYISYVGLDLSKSLSEQKCYFDEALTWEQFMIQEAIKSWQNYVLMAKMAEDSGFTLDEEWQASLEEFRKGMDDDAAENGYENADAMLRERYGENCTADTYMEYVTLVFNSNAFYSSKLTVSDEEIENAFAENESAFAEKGITKTSALVSDVRHILIAPEGGTEDAEGKKTYSEQAWAACLAEAEKVLQEWKDGEATQESFVALVQTHTDDEASSTTGGLYEGVANDGKYMEAFQNWAIDTSRAAGDVGIVQTEAGYHIMYFVDGEAEWIYHSRAKVQEERFTQLQEQMKGIEEKNKVKVKYDRIALQDIY